MCCNGHSASSRRSLCNEYVVLLDFLLCRRSNSFLLFLYGIVFCGEGREILC